MAHRRSRDTDNYDRNRSDRRNSGYEDDRYQRRPDNNRGGSGMYNDEHYRYGQNIRGGVNRDSDQMFHTGGYGRGFNAQRNNDTDRYPKADRRAYNERSDRQDNRPNQSGYGSYSRNMTREDFESRMGRGDYDDVRSRNRQGSDYGRNRAGQDDDYYGYRRQENQRRDESRGYSSDYNQRDLWGNDRNRSNRERGSGRDMETDRERSYRKRRNEPINVEDYERHRSMSEREPFSDFRHMNDDFDEDRYESRGMGDSSRWDNEYEEFDNYNPYARTHRGDRHISYRGGYGDMDYDQEEFDRMGFGHFEHTGHRTDLRSQRK